MWYQPDMQTGSWHMRWTVHREKGCMTERGSLTESVWMENHMIGPGVGRLRGEKKGCRCTCP